MVKILVIEDEPMVRTVILDILEAEEFSVMGAENGRVGVQMAMEHYPDLIICDVMMPQLDGYGVLDALKKQEETATIPFIFLTAKSTKADLRQGMELGADDYLTKPFTRNELLGAISTRLKNRQIFEQKSQKQMNELRSNITLSLPHELRTPLNGILTGSQFLIDEFQSLESDEVIEMLQDMNYSAKRLHRLIQNFLLYADLELLARDSERAKFLQNSLTKNAKLMITEVAEKQAKNHKINREADLKLQVEDAPIKIAESSLEKIIEELMDNAFKFSQAGTPVQLMGLVKNHQFILSIQDQGRGMTQEQVANLGAYQQFERKIYEQQGSGLGLIIAKRLIELHGGTLSIESQLDQGTTLHVILPMSR